MSDKESYNRKDDFLYHRQKIKTQTGIEKKSNVLINLQIYWIPETSIQHIK